MASIPEGVVWLTILLLHQLACFWCVKEEDLLLDDKNFCTVSGAADVSACDWIVGKLEKQNPEKTYHYFCSKEEDCNSQFAEREVVDWFFGGCNRPKKVDRLCGCCVYTRPQIDESVFAPLLVSRFKDAGFTYDFCEALQLPPDCTADQPCHVLISVSSFIGNESFRYDDRKNCEPGLDCHWCDQEHIPNEQKEGIDAVAYHLVDRASTAMATSLNGKFFTIGATMESNANFPGQKRAKKNYDLTMTYELDSDIPISYLKYGDQLELEHGTRASLEGRIRAAAYVASNCEEERQDYVANLINNGLSVHALGTCWVEGAQKIPINGTSRQKIEALSRYAANLAFENSDAKDYVTEKVYDGLRAGTITVYHGTTSVHKFVPDNSIITTHGLGFPELVEKIKEIWSDEAKYAELQAWRRKPFYPPALEPTKGHSHCRACRAIAALKSLSKEELWMRRETRKLTTT